MLRDASGLAGKQCASDALIARRCQRRVGRTSARMVPWLVVPYRVLNIEDREVFVPAKMVRGGTQQLRRAVPCATAKPKESAVISEGHVRTFWQLQVAAAPNNFCGYRWLCLMCTFCLHSPTTLVGTPCHQVWSPTQERKRAGGRVKEQSGGRRGADGITNDASGRRCEVGVDDVTDQKKWLWSSLRQQSSGCRL